MPREPVLPSVTFGWYYVSRRAAGKRTIIASRSERETFKFLLTATLLVNGVRVYFVYVDATEMHLGVRAGKESLTNTVGSFCERFARATNRARGETGALFRPQAHVILVEPGYWFVCLGRVIHSIPHTRGTKDADSEVSKLSTDSYYRARRRTRGLETNVIFRLVSRGSRLPAAQDAAYRAVFDRPPTVTEIDLFTHGSALHPRMVGSTESIERAARELRVLLHPRVGSTPRLAEDFRCTLAIMVENFLTVCNQQLALRTARRWSRGSTLETLCSKFRRAPLPMLRALLASYLIDSGRFRRTEVEELLRCRPRTLSAGRRRAYQLKAEALFERPYQDVIASVPVTVVLQRNGDPGGMPAFRSAPHELRVPLRRALTRLAIPSALTRVFAPRRRAGRSEACIGGLSRSVSARAVGT
jgi:hypothetical protein